MGTTISGLTSTPAHSQNYAPAATFAHSIIPTVPQAIARLCSEHGQQIWTGIVISEAGEILTTSRTLGNAPVVDIELSDGTQGQACVTGRNDNIGLALLKPFLEHRSYDFAELSDTAATLGDQLGLVQHSSFSPTLDERITLVNGYQSVSGGYDYFRIRAADTTSDGAVLTNPYDQMQGVRMPSLWLLQHEIGNPGEVWAVDAATIVDAALPVLRSGGINIETPTVGEVDSSPPPSHGLILHGEVTVDGSPAPAGSTVYARLVKDGLPDHWASTTIGEPGFLLMNVSAPSNSYVGATIEFWMDCRRTSTTAVFDHAPGSRVDVNLAF